MQNTRSETIEAANKYLVYLLISGQSLECFAFLQSNEMIESFVYKISRYSYRPGVTLDRKIFSIFA